MALSQLPPDGDPYPKPAGPNLKELAELQLILSAPEKKKMFESLKVEVVLAKDVQQEIKEVKKVTKKVYEIDTDSPIDSGVLRALRQYRNPKPLVHDIIIAFLMLLGEIESDTRVCIINLFKKKSQT